MTAALGLLALAWLFSRPSAAEAQTPAPSTSPARPPVTQGDAPALEVVRYNLTTTNKRTDQPYVESLFRAAAVDGWFYGPTGREGEVSISLRDVNQETAQLRLLNLDAVSFLEQA